MLSRSKSATKVHKLEDEKLRWLIRYATSATDLKLIIVV